MQPQLLQLIQNSKYLSHYAEPEIEALAQLPYLGSLQPVVVPIYDEPIDFFGSMTHYLPAAHPVLWILVLNCPENASTASQQRTRAVQTTLLDGRLLKFKSERLILLDLKPAGSILIVDRIDPALPTAQGVGLARKIGCDIACQLMVSKKIAPAWLATTDADAVLPEDYFQQLQYNTQTANPSALIFPFQHQKGVSEETHKATLLYEQHLNHLTTGLRLAGSPYAYHAMGSTMAIDPLAYCYVRGFPRRSAGEDFYLLNKLQKYRAVRCLEGQPVRLKSRVSQRVGFGTGPAVQQILSNTSNSGPLSTTTYHDSVFQHLKAWLDEIQHIATLAPEQRLACLTTHLAHAPYRSWLPSSRTFEKQILLFNQHSCTSEAFLKQFHHWFDALKTIQFLNQGNKVIGSRVLHQP